MFKYGLIFLLVIILQMCTMVNNSTGYIILENTTNQSYNVGVSYFYYTIQPGQIINVSFFSSTHEIIRGDVPTIVHELDLNLNHIYHFTIGKTNIGNALVISDFAL